MMDLRTKSGERHGIINRVANSVTEDQMKKFSEKDRSKMEALRKEQSRPVKVQYLNSRGKNERLTTPYCKWAGDPIDSWHFIPEEIYEVPMGLVEQVNDKNKHIPKRSEVLDKNGRPTAVDGSSEWLHKLIPAGF